MRPVARSTGLPGRTKVIERTHARIGDEASRLA